MATAGPESSSEKSLRLWPGVAGALIVVFARFVIAPFVPGGGLIGLVVGAAGAALILLWWLFFSRARWLERIGAILLVALAAVMTQLFAHPSIGGGTTTGGMLFVFLLPATVPPFLVAGVILSRRSSRGVRWATMAAAIFLGSGVWVLARSDGIKGEARLQLAWRWTRSAEERLLTAARDETLPSLSTVDKPAGSPAAGEAAAPIGKPGIPAGDPRPRDIGKPPDAGPTVAPILWSGFRGRERDAVLDGVRINTDWNAAKPEQVWRRPAGPGWSSFAVAGDLIFTQEQRGDDELISAYRLRTGEPVWRHAGHGAILRAGWRGRTAWNTNGTRRPCICHGRDRHPECAGREDRRAHLDARRSTRHGCSAARLGVRGVAVGRRGSSGDGRLRTSRRLRSHERHATLDAENNGRRL